MKNRLRVAAVLMVSASFMMGVASCEKLPPPNFVDLTIFHTNDIHSHLKPNKSEPFQLGGLARVSTLLKQLRQNNSNTLTLDAGDWSEGTWHYNVDVGANMLRFFEKMGYDAVCLGNHDFLNGPDQVIKTVSDAGSSVPVLASNFDASGYSRGGELKQATPPYTIKRVNGIKIGIIGLTTYEIFYESYIAPVKISSPFVAAAELAVQLRPQVDVLLLLSHNAFDRNTDLAASILGVDAVISGHSHKKVPKAVLVKNAGKDVPVVETGMWAQFVGELKLSVDKDKKIVQFKDYQLHPVSADIAEDPEIVAMIAEQDELLSEKVGDDVNRIVSHAEFDVHRGEDTDSPLGNLAVKSYRSATGADLSLDIMTLTGVGFNQGDVTLKDLHDVAPHIYNPITGKEWTVQVWNARGSDLWLLFNVFYTVSGLMPLGSPLGWLSSDNTQIRWDPSSIGNVSFDSILKMPNPMPWVQAIPTVKEIKIGGQPLNAGSRYRVALNDGLLLGIRTFTGKVKLPLDLSDVQNSGIETSKSVINYASAGPRRLSLDNLRVNYSLLSDKADLAVFSYNINWDGTQLEVEVENHGNEASAAGTQLVCHSGIPNGYVPFGTDLQSWTEIGRVALTSIAGAISTKVQMTWNKAQLPSGYLPVKCEVVSDSDPFVPNNHAVRVFHTSSLSASSSGS